MGIGGSRGMERGEEEEVLCLKKGSSGSLCACQQGRGEEQKHILLVSIIQRQPKVAKSRA